MSILENMVGRFNVFLIGLVLISFIVKNIWDKIPFLGVGMKYFSEGFLYETHGV